MKYILSFLFSSYCLLLWASPCDSNQLDVRVVLSDTLLCPGDYINLEAKVSGGVGPYEYDWGGLENDPVFAGGPLYSDTIVQLRVTDKGCGKQVQVATPIELVDLNAEFSLTAEHKYYVGSPLRLQNRSKGAELIRLNSLAPNGELTSKLLREQPDFDLVFPEPGQYQIALDVYNTSLESDSSLACRVRDTLLIEVLDSPSLYIPNAFAPSGKGPNQVFSAVGSDISEYHMSIFGRFGEVIFSCDHLNCAWDGRDKHGLLMQPRTYLYRIVVVQGGLHREYEGYVALVR